MDRSHWRISHPLTVTLHAILLLFDFLPFIIGKSTLKISVGGDLREAIIRLHGLAFVAVGF
jgi:hypothetical protein